MKYWLWLWSVKGVGPATARNLLARFREPQAIYEATTKELLSVRGIGPATVNNIHSTRSFERAHLLLKDCRENEISILTFDDPRYPEIAKGAKIAPILLFFKGNIPENFCSVAIVGPRRCSQYAKETTLNTAAFLAENGIAVVSGMAKGVDSYAHVACIRSGGYTVAFVGCGLDICYPAEHSQLMAAIARSGAVISEYPPGSPARAEHFPARNRLISSWSDKVLVIEAGEKSGALITADFARKEGREVLVLTGDAGGSAGKGSLRLVQDEGAKVFSDHDQLLPDGEWKQVFARESVKKSEDRLKAGRRVTRSSNARKASLPEAGVFKPTSENRGKWSGPAKTESASKKNQEFADLSPTEKLIITSISQRPKSIESISFESGIPQGALLRQLATMEVEGMIRSLPGARYVITT